MAKKAELPEWFPFALIASAVIAIGAGVRSGWKTAADQPPSPLPPSRGVAGEWGF